MITFTQQDKKNIFLLAVATTMIIFAPTLFGYLSTENGNTYTGIHILSPADYPVYYSYIEQVRQGHFIFKDLFTSEPQARVMLNPFWIPVGLLAKLFNLSAQTAFHLARLALAPALVATIYLFMAQVFRDTRNRLGATITTLTTAGFGFFVTPLLTQLPKKAPLGQFSAPPDMWTGEANTFLTLLHSPHFMVSSILLLVFLILWSRALETKNMRTVTWTGVLLLLWFTMHPFFMATIAVIAAAYTVLSYAIKHPDRMFVLKSALVMGIISSPALLYYLYLIAFDWLTATRALQNINLTPNIWLMLLGFGLLVPLALLGWNQFKKNATPSHLTYLILLWLPLHWLLIYIPLNFQRRLTHGLHVVTALFAWIGISLTYAYFKKRFPEFSPTKKILTLAGANLAALLLIFTTLGNWLTEFDVIHKKQDHIFLSAAQQSSFTWMQNNLSEKDVVLADTFSGILTPGFSGKTSFAGHGVETAYYHCCKQHQVFWFFDSATTDEKRKQFLRDNNITHVYHNPRFFEQPTFDIVNAQYLNQVFRHDDITIFETQ